MLRTHPLQVNSARMLCLDPDAIESDTVQKPPVLLITVIDIMRDQLDLNLLKKTVPNDAPWWTQLEYNAQRGLVIRRRWNARLQTFVELLGTMEQKDDCWKWEKAGDSRVRDEKLSTVFFLTCLYRGTRRPRRYFGKGRRCSRNDGLRVGDVSSFCEVQFCDRLEFVVSYCFRCALRSNSNAFVTVRTCDVNFTSPISRHRATFTQKEKPTAGMNM